MSGLVILDLCGGSGSWSAPYRASGYDVRLVTLPEHDVRFYAPPRRVHGVLAAPPCTEFASSGARWWAGKPPSRLREAVNVVRACLRIIESTRPRWWALENPVGRLRTCVPELGEPALKFDPCDFGDPYTKRTMLWGTFTRPAVRRVHPTHGSKMARMSSSWSAQRAVTPPGFARAFFEANP